MLRAILMGITLGAGTAASARESGDQALHQLEATVQKSCACAAAQTSGVRAALACTGELKTFSALKLDNAQRWSPRQRRLAGRMEQILETCLSEALSYRRTLIRLGVAAPFARPPAIPTKTAAPYRWEKIQPSQLGRHPSRLVRIETSDGKSVKGLVSQLRRDSLRLQRARGDGGGLLSFKLEAIHGAWVLLPAAPDPERR